MRPLLIAVLIALPCTAQPALELTRNEAPVYRNAPLSTKYMDQSVTFPHSGWVYHVKADKVVVSQPQWQTMMTLPAITINLPVIRPPSGRKRAGGCAVRNCVSMIIRQTGHPDIPTA